MRRLILPLLLLLTIPAILLAKDYKVITFTTQNAGRIVFDHDLHLSKLSKNCTICHNSIFQVAKENPKATMADMEQGKSCGACHNKTKAFGVNECIKCHVVGDIPIEIPDFGAVTFSHSFHLGVYGCNDCHNAIFKAGPGNPHFTMARMEKGEACGACHDGKTAFTVKENCTRCHTVKEINFKADALFSHKFHLDMYKCNDCHNKFFIAGPGAKRYTMLEMEKGKSCGGCHDGSTAFTVKSDCAKCHKGAPREVAFAPTNALFSHTFHLGMYKCGDCHSGVFVGGVNSKRYTMADMEKAKSCGACHDGGTAFNVTGSCAKCHKSAKDITFAIKDAGTVAFSHDIHTAMFKCDDCHNKIFTTGTQSKRYTMADMEKGKSCGACHDGKGAFSVAGSCGKCHPVKEITFVDDAKFDHNKHLEMYKCSDCHAKLFAAGPDNKRWKMADMEKGKSCGACHDGSTAFSAKGDCDKCHKTTVEVSINVPATGVTIFSHKAHTGMYKCAECHYGIFQTGANAKRYKMADMEGGKSCGACHDGKTAFTVKENCARCHPVKDIAFKETAAVFSHNFHIGLYRCTDCHDAIFKPGAGNKKTTMPEMENGNSCGACHDGKTAFSVNGACEKCHTATKSIQYEVPGSAGSVLFSHKIHTGKGYGCTDCHSKLIKAGVARRDVKMKEMEEGKSCGGCHGFSMAFSVKDPQNCEKCHNDTGGFQAPPGMPAE